MHKAIWHKIRNLTGILMFQVGMQEVVKRNCETPFSENASGGLLLEISFEIIPHKRKQIDIFKYLPRQKLLCKNSNELNFWYDSNKS